MVLSTSVYPQSVVTFIYVWHLKDSAVVISVVGVAVVTVAVVTVAVVTVAVVTVAVVTVAVVTVAVVTVAVVTTVSFSSPHSFDPEITFSCFLPPVMLLKSSQVPS